MYTIGMTIIIALLATFSLTILLIFHILLIFGAPFGHYAWGGRHRVLPKELRLATVSTVAAYLAFIVIALSQAGIVQIIQPGVFLDFAVWAVAIYMYFGVLGNGLSTSRPERFVMVPVSATLAILFTYLALA